MSNITVTSKHPGHAARHIERKGKPACGTPPEGALVVEEVKDVSCIDCLILNQAVARLIHRAQN